MVEEELAHGEGWISDDSSFYGEYFQTSGTAQVVTDKRLP